MVARSVLRPLNVIAVRIGKEGRSVFDLELFKSECAEAASRGAGQQAIREIVARAVEAPGAVLNSLGEPRRAEVKTLHRSADLTILNVIWGPRMTVMPHNHNMWAVIGIYTGREDNILWRRRPDASGSRIEAAGAKALGERDTLPLSREMCKGRCSFSRRATGCTRHGRDGSGERHGVDLHRRTLRLRQFIGCQAARRP